MILKFNLILVTDERIILEKDNSLSLSLAMGIIASYLKEKGVESVIHDTNKFATEHMFTDRELELISHIYDKNRVLAYINKEKDDELDEVAAMFLHKNYKEYDAFGISIGADFSMLQIHLGFVMAAFLKRQTNKPVIIGGNNISYLYIFKDFYKELLLTAIKEFPFMIKGPGEQIIWEILEGIHSARDSMYFKQIDGLLLIDNGEISANKEREPLVIRPDWDSLNIDDYIYPLSENKRENEEIYYRFPLALSNIAVAFQNKKVKKKRIIIPYIFNYNCIYNCAFCTQSDSDRKGMIIGDVKKVADDLEYLSKKYDSQYFYFLNNYFPSSLEYIKAFREELKSRNLEIYWSDCGRVNGLTLEKLQLLYECGCRKLVFGFETGSEKILKLIDKRLNLDELKSVLKWCKNVGIWADVEVIVGLPHEHEEEFLSTYNFLKEHNNLVNHFWINEYFVVPNSLIGKYPDRYGVELLKNRTTYEETMRANQKYFTAKDLVNLTSNARLWGFREMDDDTYKDYEDMRVQNSSKILRLSKLMNKEFNQLFDFYSKLLKLRKA